MWAEAAASLRPHAGHAGAAIGLMDCAGVLQLSAQRLAFRFGQQCGAIPSTLARANQDEATLEVQVLEPELTALRDAEAPTIDQRSHEPCRAAHGLEERGGFGQAQDGRQVGAAPRARDLAEAIGVECEHFARQEQQGAECLILSGRRDAVMDGQMGEEITDALGRDARLRFIVLSQVVQEAAHPVDVTRLGTIGVVTGADAYPQGMERGDRVGSAVCPDDVVSWRVFPVSAREEVHEVESKRLVGLMDLPFLPSCSFEIFAKCAYAVGQ